MGRVTQSQIAQRVGISTQAVAYALSGRAELKRKLSPRTTRRVLEAAEQLGYVPHFAARRLVRERGARQGRAFEQVGLIYLTRADLDVDPICLSMMGAAEHEISNFNASLTFVRVRQRDDWAKVDRLLRGGAVDGWLLYGFVGDEAIDRIESAHVPHVVLGDHRCTRPVHYVNIDNAGVGRLAARHLAELGHRRIGYLHSRFIHVYQDEMRAGFLAACEELGLERDERLAVHHDMWQVPDNCPAALAWLNDVKPTALFTAEFDAGIVVRDALRQANLAVPEQISVLGTEPERSNAVRTMGVTHIQLPMSEVGRQGAILLREIATSADDRARIREVRVPAVLIDGTSSGPSVQSKQL
jgi:LacI family transcriptional regulator